LELEVIALTSILSLFPFAFAFLLSFSFSSPNSQPSSLREKGPSLRKPGFLSSTTFTTFVLLSGGCQSAGARPVPFSYSSFYLPFIWVSLFKDRGVAMGKPHCNSSI